MPAKGIPSKALLKLGNIQIGALNAMFHHHAHLALVHITCMSLQNVLLNERWLLECAVVQSTLFFWLAVLIFTPFLYNTFSRHLGLRPF